MKVIVTDGRVIAIPTGFSPATIAHWYNPGLLPDEYEVVHVLVPNYDDLWSQTEGGSTTTGDQ